MKKSLLCMCTVFVFFIAAAVAQTTPDNTNSGSQGTSNSSPSMSEGTAQNPNTPGSMSNPNSTTNTSNEKKMKGCIQSQNGQYVLETKKGHNIALTGQDVSAHVGHEVSVRGMWEGSNGNMSNTSSGTGMASGKSFNVTSVDMISDTCTMGKGKSSSGMSSGMSNSGNSTGNSTTPPQ